MENLNKLYDELADLQLTERGLKFDIQNIRTKLGVKVTPAKSDNNPKSREQDPELYDALVKFEIQHKDILKRLHFVQDRIDDLEGNYDYDDDFLDLYHYDEN